MKQIRIGALLSYVSIFLTFIVGLIYTPILIRLLGQSDYGLYSLVLAFASYLTLMDMGVGNAIVRYIARNKVIGDSEKESNLIGSFIKFFSAISFLTLIAGYLIYFNAPNIFINSLNEEEIKTAQIMILILTVNFSLSFPLNVFSAVLQAYERFIFLKFLSILRVLLVPLIILAILNIGGGLISMTLVTSIINISILISGYIYFRRVMKLKVTFAPIDKNLKKEIYTFAFLIFLTSIADKIYWQTDQTLLGILKNPETVAIYAIAIQFVLIFMSLSTAFSSLFLPRFTKIVTEENHFQKLNSEFIKISRIQFYILALALSGFIIFGKEFILLWAGLDYEQAYIIIVILMIPFFFDLIQNMGLVVLQAKGLFLFRTVTLIICSILNLIISIPIIIVYGSIGTAIVSSVFIAIGNVLLLNLYYHFKIGLNIKLYWLNIIKIMIPVLLLSIIFIIIKVILNIENNLNILLILMYIISYILITFLFSFNNEEKGYLRKFSNLVKKKLMGS